MVSIKHKLTAFVLTLMMVIPTITIPTLPAFCEDIVIQQSWQEFCASDTQEYHSITQSPTTGNFEIQQNNKRRDPGVQIVHVTIAYQFTNLTTGESFYVGRNDMNTVTYQSVDPATGQTRYRIVSSFTAEQSARLTAWASNGGVVQADNVNTVSFDGGTTTSAVFNYDTGIPEINDHFNRLSAWARAVIEASGGDGAFSKDEYEAFANCIPWRDKVGLKTNFEKLLQMYDGKLYEVPPEILIELLTPPEDPNDPTIPTTTTDLDFIQRSTTGVGTDTENFASPGLSLGKVDYYNDSRNYHEDGIFHRGFADAFDTDGNGPGLIIPSSEKLLAAIRSRTYAGTCAIHMGLASHDFTYSEFGYDYTEIKWHEVPGYMANTDDDDPDNDYWVNPHWEPYDSRTWTWKIEGQTTPVTGTTTRMANFLYISDLDMYDFSNASVANDAYGSTSFNNTDSHCLEDIQPAEDGNGDPIGPVDSADGYSLRQDRPEYETVVRCIDESPKVGAGNGTPQSDFPAGVGPEYPEHIDWGTIGNVEEDDKFLGAFSTDIYDPAEYSAPQAGTVGIPGPAQAIADARMYDWVGTGVDEDLSNEKHLKYMTGAKFYAITNTDGLILGYDRNVVIQQASVDVHFNADESCFTEFRAYNCKRDGKWPSYLAPYVTSAMSNMRNLIAEVPDNETYESTPAFGLAQLEIPANKHNYNNYTTSLPEWSYSPILYYSSSAPVTVNEGGYKSEYYNNEPIIVQTPVVAPVLVYDDPDTTKDDGSPLYPTESTSSYFNMPINTLPNTEGTPKGVSDQTERKTQHLYTGEGVGRDDQQVQLRLDETYWFKFDPMTHLKTQGYIDLEKAYEGKFDNAWEDGDIKFDKYVQAKYIHFPFAVGVYHGDDELPTYYPLVTDEDEEGYWIKIYGTGPDDPKDLIWTRFYIPSWAIEGSYPGDEGLSYKVESINVTDDEGYIHDDDESKHELLNDEAYDEETGMLNPDGLKDATADDNKLYIATYKIGVQVSGWVYDFQVVGINNRDAYDKDLSAELAGQWHDLYYPFAWNYEEKKAGDKNRLGGDSRYASESAYVRYTRSGEIAHEGDQVEHSTLIRQLTSAPVWSNKNTTVIDNTKSNRYTDSGTPPKGTEFAFSLKTMQNLWNVDDYIEITPSFWYQADTGEQYNQNPGPTQLHLYYNDVSGTTENLYIEYKQSRDQSNIKKVSLANEMFNGSYADSDVEYTVQYKGYNESEAMFETYIGDYSGDDVSDLVNQFKSRQNDSYNLSEINLSSNLRLFSGDEDLYKTNLTLDTDSPSVKRIQGGIFKDMDTELANKVDTCIQPSIQTWYGIYTIPATLHASLMTQEEIREYAETHGGITDDDPNVWLTDGYLIVHFDIKTHNAADSTKDLSYGGQYAHNQNMWKDQNQDITAEVGNPITGGDGHYSHTDIEVNYGDVIVIDMKESLDDWFNADIWTTQ